MGAWLSQALWAAARLEVADALAQGPRSPAQLAVQLGVDADALARLLRALSAHGVFVVRADGRFAHSELSQCLRRDVAGSLRDYLLFVGHPKQRDAWARLDLTMRAGRPAQPGLFERMAEDRELGCVFDAAMSCLSRLGSAATHASYDFSRFATIVDVGGGRGANLVAMLRVAPQARGVLFDLPEVIAEARERLAEHALGERIRVDGGSFFERIPEGGDAYVLKHILHDWSDERALAILRNVRRAMGPEATLVIIESVLPEGGRAHMAQLIDLEMLVIDGKERSEREWRGLLACAGFALARIVPSAGPVSVIEARPVDTVDV